MDEKTKIKIRLSEFKFVLKRDRIKGARRILRFTLHLDIYSPDAGHIGIQQEGCLAQVKSDGRLAWSPPLHQIGWARKAYTLITPDLYEIVERALKNSKYEKRLRDPIDEIIRPLHPHELDEELPLELHARE